MLWKHDPNGPLADHGNAAHSAIWGLVHQVLCPPCLMRFQEVPGWKKLSPLFWLEEWGDSLSNVDRAVLYCRNGFHGRKPRVGSPVSLAARSLYHSRAFRYAHIMISVAYMYVLDLQPGLLCCFSHVLRASRR